MLTLASNERIPLTPSMRLLLEINHMNHCSPATVSRGGVIYVNAEDVGWEPAWRSWLARVALADLQPILQSLGTKYESTAPCRNNMCAWTDVHPCLPAVNCTTAHVALGTWSRAWSTRAGSPRPSSRCRPSP